MTDNSNAQLKEQPSNVVPFPQAPNPAIVLPSAGTVGRIVLGFVPFTPVEFFGKDAWIAWTRVAGFSLLAYLTYNKMRPLSYGAMGAVGVSLATSLMGKAWHK